MSALEAEPISLAFDSSDAAAGAREFVSSRGSVLQYVTAIRAVRLGPQPIVIGGQQSGSYDPLEKRHDLVDAINAARYRADNVTRYLDGLHGWAGGQARGLADMVITPLTALRDIVAAIPADGSITEAKLREAITQYQTAKIFTMMIAGNVDGIVAGIRTFLDAISTDHDTLVRGPLAVNQAIAEVETNSRNAALPYIGNPMTAPIGKIILEIGAQMRARLVELSGTLGAALQGHEQMRGGIMAFATGTATARAKYEAAGSAMDSAATAAARALVLRRLDLKVAIRSWEQFRDFLLNSGF